MNHAKPSRRAVVGFGLAAFGPAFQGGQLLSTAAVKTMTTNHLSPHERRRGAAILGKSVCWGYGMSIGVDVERGQRKPGLIGWFGGFGTSWHSDPARNLTAILLTQRAFESPEPAPLNNPFAVARSRNHGTGNRCLAVLVVRLRL